MQYRQWSIADHASIAQITAAESIPQIVNRLVRQMGYHNAVEINDDGMFWVFSDKLAQAIRAIIGGPPEQTYRLDSDQIDAALPAHEWVVHQGRHYDAETPDGVADPLELAYFQRDGLPTWFTIAVEQADA